MYINNGEKIFNLNMVQSISIAESRITPSKAFSYDDIKGDFEKYCKNSFTFYCAKPAPILKGYDINLSFGGSDIFILFRSPDKSMMQALFDDISDRIGEGFESYRIRAFLFEYYCGLDRIQRLACLSKWYVIPKYEFYPESVRERADEAAKYI